MSRHHHWQTQRQMIEQADGWSRWDRAYQMLLSWSSGPLNTKPYTYPREETIQEKSHAHRDVCPGIYPNASSGSNH
jgi:hypothetical protein